jgi:hypothetical protein
MTGQLAHMSSGARTFVLAEMARPILPPTEACRNVRYRRRDLIASLHRSRHGQFRHGAATIALMVHQANKQLKSQGLRIVSTRGPGAEWHNSGSGSRPVE